MEKREERHEVCRKKPLTNFWFSAFSGNQRFVQKTGIRSVFLAAR